MCMYIYIYIYIHTYICIYVYIYIYMCMYMCYMCVLESIRRDAKVLGGYGYKQTDNI